MNVRQVVSGTAYVRQRLLRDAHEESGEAYAAQARAMFPDLPQEYLDFMCGSSKDDE